VFYILFDSSLNI